MQMAGLASVGRWSDGSDRDLWYRGAHRQTLGQPHTGRERGDARAHPPTLQTARPSLLTIRPVTDAGEKPPTRRWDAPRPTVVSYHLPPVCRLTPPTSLGKRKSPTTGSFFLVSSDDERGVSRLPAWKSPPKSTFAS